MALPPSIDRVWIATELAKGIDAERALGIDAKARAEAPPDAVLSVLYHEIAAADERHATIVETIAARYGHTPSQSSGGGIGRALGHLRDKFVGLGSAVLDQLMLDVTAKAQSVHWHIAWVHVFGVIGDSQSARELAAVLAEEQAHRDALQQGLNRLIEQQARGAVEVNNGPLVSEPAR
jgi:hypothetical protein